MTRSWFAAVAVVVVFCSGCGNHAENKTEGHSNSPASTAQSTAGTGAKVDAKAAKEIYDSRCAPCHGTSGKGDGPGAAALNPKPRNYTDKAWQTGVTDEQIRKTIVYGGAAVGKSPIMPASPDLDGKPEVVDGIVGIVRGFGK